MKAELHQDVRIKRDENYEVLSSIENQIAARIRAEFESEVSAVRAENKKFHEQDLKFREEAREVLKTTTTHTLLKVQIQVGKGSTVIQEYTGHLAKNFKHSDGYFDFVTPDRHDGRPFTIGFSCLLSVEILTL